MQSGRAQRACGAARAAQAATKGLDAVEEMDPVERMRMRYGIGSEGPGRSAAASPPRISSLEEELEATLNKIDIKNFDYVPVPRPPDEEDEGA